MCVSVGPDQISDLLSLETRRTEDDDEEDGEDRGAHDQPVEVGRLLDTKADDD